MLRCALLIGAAAALAGLLGLSDRSPATAVRLEAAAPILVDPLPAVREPVHTRVVAGDTIESVCRRLDDDGWVLWRDALTAEIDPRKLQPGTGFEGFRNSAGGLAELHVHLDLRTRLVLQRDGDGIEVVREERALERELVQLEGVITSSLFGAVEAAGGEPELAVAMAEIFQWDIDFLRDLREGDRFVVVVDRMSVDGAHFGYGTIFAARFVNGERVLDAVVYPDADGRLGYYDPEGRPLRKQFLRSPLKFSRITSRFSMNRFHPVLKRGMPHYGVDYGAPVGTPVMVTADGVVSFAGANAGAGRMVTVRHPNGYETNYLHLSKFANGIRPGRRVGQGDVIGFVGSTGLSTGPHLDYRVKLNSRWINPLSISSPPVQPLEGDRLGRFLGHALAVVRLLEGHNPPAGAQC